MADVATASVGLVPNTQGFGRKLTSGIGGDLDRAGRDGGRRFAGGMQTSLRVGATRIFSPLIAAAGAIAVGDFFKDSFAEARESQKVGATTTQIIKSTGGAAKVTAGQVGDLATAISNKTGIDDEAVQSGSNLLLTFKNVRNEVGQGANIFDRATAAAVDLSKAGFGDINSASKTLGKALNDPVKGLTALGRAGVTFTQGQKDQIKAMVKSGDVLGAQKIILKEVESQVGGVAAATATAGDKFSTTFANFKESVGTALLPILDAVLTKASAFFGFLSTQVGPALGKVADFVAPVAGAIQGLFSGAGGGASAFAPVVEFIQTKVIPAFTGIVDAVRGFLSVAIPIVQQFVSGMIQRIQPLMPQIQAIFGTIGGIVTGAMGLIQAVIQRVTAVISFIWTNWGQGIMNFIGAVWSAIIGIVGPALEVIRAVIATVTAAIRGDWSGAWEGIKGIFAGIWNLIKGIVSGALGIIKQLLSAAWGAIRAGVSAGWNAITSAISGAIARIVTAVVQKGAEILTWFKELPGKIVSVLSGLPGALFSAGSDMIGGFIRGLISRAGELVATIRDKVIGVLPDFVKNFLGIHSPSRVFMKLGAQTAAGMAVGLESGARDVRKAARSLIPSTRPGSYAVDVSATGSLYGQRLHPADLQELGRLITKAPPGVVGIDPLGEALMSRRP